MRILAIGNSFSDDATYYLHQMGASAGKDLEVYNLYVGGCSLETHCENLDQPFCSLFCNGQDVHQVVSVRQMLQKGPWDRITCQQVSGLSGIKASYEPWGSLLLDEIHREAPGVPVWFHRTWAYAVHSEHPDFPRYGSDQERMDQAIREASAEFASRHGLPVIPTGEVIHRLRHEPCFASEGPDPLCRDEFHMSMDWGRYAVALCWYETLAGDSREVTFAPEGVEGQRKEVIGRIVRQVCGSN